MGVEIKAFDFGHPEPNAYGLRPGPNSVGGISISGVLQNNSSKTIKYCDIKFVPYNSVGDAVSCIIGHCSEVCARFTGPLEPGKSESFLYQNMWYNCTISSVKITGADIEYMDGTKESIPGEELPCAYVIKGGGCYVATAVYGSYDCPQVWTLRRFRDYTLAKTWYGRAFIRTYYAISPTLVKWFGHTAWFKKMWKGKLDRMVANLNAKGVEDTPYADKQW